MEELIQDVDMEIPIVVLKEFTIESYVMGFHDYKSIWIPEVG